MIQLALPARSSLAELIVDAVPEDSDEELASRPAFHPLDDRDRRAVVLLGRLVLGVLAELSSPEQVEAIERHRVFLGTRGASSPRGAPKAWTFVLKRSVTVDCRDAVSDYLSRRKATTPTVQVLVRGHWKRQAHGPGGALRKLIHVEPYWRGPEDAPIAVRPH